MVQTYPLFELTKPHVLFLGVLNIARGKLTRNQINSLYGRRQVLIKVFCDKKVDFENFIFVHWCIFFVTSASGTITDGRLWNFCGLQF